VSATSSRHAQELRRGADPALVHSLAFSRGCEWLAVSSDKSTVRIGVGWGVPAAACALVIGWAGADVRG